ncbi:hypothetical protein MWLp12_0382 [Lactiplantibacillus plantarum]|nr:hypothetical protein MWLp12_0382 [Lactiplantibacillus plantarum]
MLTNKKPTNLHVSLSYDGMLQIKLICLSQCNGTIFLV